MNFDSIPVDLITEIFSRLPQKSIARFLCVSKLCASILRSSYFTEYFLTRSSAKPRLLFAIEEKGVWGFFSSHQHHNPYDMSSWSFIVAAEFHMKFPPENMKIYSFEDRRFACGYASGLVYFYGMWIKEEDRYGVPVICNPKTGQYVTLPYLLRYRKSYSFFGFDPIDKQFKVLFMAYPGCSDNHKIMTLGTRKMKWRTIQCPLPHFPLCDGICINGVLYYSGDCKGYVKPDVLVDDERSDYDYVVVCFDVRSEKFKFIYVESPCVLINYKGKLCLIYWKDDDVYWKDDVINGIELRVWVLEDAEKQEWSKYSYTLWDDKFFFVDGEYAYIEVVGVTTMGEIILSMGEYRCNQPFYVFYFNLEKNTLQRVEIQGFGEYYHEAFTKVFTFANHVEDLKVNDTIKHQCFIREENKKMKKMKMMKKKKKKKDKMKNKKGKEKIGVR